MSTEYYERETQIIWISPNKAVTYWRIDAEWWRIEFSNPVEKVDILPVGYEKTVNREIEKLENSDL